MTHAGHNECHRNDRNNEVNKKGLHESNDFPAGLTGYEQPFRYHATRPAKLVGSSGGGVKRIVHWSA